MKDEKNACRIFQRGHGRLLGCAGSGANVVLPWSRCGDRMGDPHVSCGPMACANGFFSGGALLWGIGLPLSITIDTESFSNSSYFMERNVIIIMASVSIADRGVGGRILSVGASQRDASFFFC